jgi:hypothetical protein
MNNPPSTTSIQAGGVSDLPIRRSPCLENCRLLLGGNGDGASSPAPAPPDPAQAGTVPTRPQGSGGGVAQGGVRGTAAHAGRVVGVAVAVLLNPAVSVLALLAVAVLLNPAVSVLALLLNLAVALLLLLAVVVLLNPGVVDVLFLLGVELAEVVDDSTLPS